MTCFFSYGWGNSTAVLVNFYWLFFSEEAGWGQNLIENRRGKGGNAVYLKRVEISCSVSFFRLSLYSIAAFFNFLRVILHLPQNGPWVASELRISVSKEQEQDSIIGKPIFSNLIILSKFQRLFEEESEQSHYQTCERGSIFPFQNTRD